MKMKKIIYREQYMNKLNLYKDKQIIKVMLTMKKRKLKKVFQKIIIE